MPRAVNKDDGILEKTIKLIPTEIVAIYILVVGFIPETVEDNVRIITLSVIAGVCVILTPLYLRFGMKIKFKDESDPEKVNMDTVKQMLVSILSFAVWVFALGGPFYAIAFIKANTWIGSIVLAFWSLISGLIIRPKA